ncbi:Winged helix DNA-binding domain-containing protein [Klenkia soli]|uniref:Winged helix DNA-binding domain-containing protein n=1 Tax=Klenkia soli TaxID=1052260 RepID=A0A1H0KA48_9ACTN|nr:crosslink repair DNA glycosylase YcaQ family protein [Klenkia soli]SDO52759.1 Winged helix DNA-binding domain-containing protein [Klenkia soli]
MTTGTTTWTRDDVLAHRVRAHQLDRDTGGTVADTAVLDLGVQETGPAGAGRWALQVRGLLDPADDDLVTAWTLRGAPHTYRRADLAGVAAATWPWSEADAAKRIFDGARPLRAAGIPVLDALDHVAAEMRDVAAAPTVKGDMSGALRHRLPEPYLRFCTPCGAVHAYEQTFRLAALHAGLVLRPGTSPPVLEQTGVRPAAAVPEQLDVVRAHLRLFGPSTPKQVAAYVDSTVAEVERRWPADAEPVTVDGEQRWVLPGAEPPDRVRTTRLLAPFDPYLQVRDRELLVPDRPVKELWPVLGRPGAVLVDGEVAGTWRPTTKGGRLSLAITRWRPVEQAAVEEQAEAMAAARGLAPGGVSLDPPG